MACTWQEQRYIHLILIFTCNWYKDILNLCTMFDWKIRCTETAQMGPFVFVLTVVNRLASVLMGITVLSRKQLK